MSEYEKPYLILSKAINEAIKNIDSNEKEIIKKYLIVAQNIANKALEKEKNL